MVTQNTPNVNNDLPIWQVPPDDISGPISLTPEEIASFVDDYSAQPGEDFKTQEEIHARNFVRFRDAIRNGSPQGSTVDLGAWAHIGDEMLAHYATGGGAEAAMEVYEYYVDRNAAFRAAMQGTTPTTGPVFAPLSFSELLNRPPKQWMIDNIIGRGDIAMIYGPPGSKKTFVVIDLVICCCQGKQFAGRFDIDTPLSVAYCAGEGLSGLGQRFQAAANHHRVSELPNFEFYEIVPQLFTSDAGEVMSRFIRERQERLEAGQVGQLDLLVIDTLHSATVGAEENSSKDMGKALEAIKEASAKLGCAVIIVHHTNKAGTGERGSSALRGAMDSMIKLVPKGNGDYTTMYCDKLKDGEEWDEQDLCLMADGHSAHVWWNEPKPSDDVSDELSAERSRIIGALDEHGALTSARLREATGGSKTNTERYLGRLVDEGLVKRELKNPDRASSPQNPFVYSINPQEEEAA